MKELKSHSNTGALPLGGFMKKTKLPKKYFGRITIPRREVQSPTIKRASQLEILPCV